MHKDRENERVSPPASAWSDCRNIYVWEYWGWQKLCSLSFRLSHFLRTMAIVEHRTWQVYFRISYSQKVLHIEQRTMTQFFLIEWTTSRNDTYTYIRLPRMSSNSLWRSSSLVPSAVPAVCQFTDFQYQYNGVLGGGHNYCETFRKTTQAIFSTQSSRTENRTIWKRKRAVLTPWICSSVSPW